MVNISNLNLNTAKVLGYKIVNRGDNNKNYKSKNRRDDRHEKINDAHASKQRIAKDKLRFPCS
jgi:hypothetical protein